MKDDEEGDTGGGPSISKKNQNEFMMVEEKSRLDTVRDDKNISSELISTQKRSGNLSKTRKIQNQSSLEIKKSKRENRLEGSLKTSDAI